MKEKCHTVRTDPKFITKSYEMQNRYT